jgi:hypothetical protein
MTTPVVALSLGLQSLANDLEKRLVDMTGEQQDFVLIVGLGNVVQYVSNAPREMGLVMMFYLIDNWSRNLPDVPAHPDPEL